ncbi:MAG: hypothetical protein L3J74_04655 [Bacteroidales bacterium]|nr:hypothetical protein [Bacteroidales bacterium]
MKKLSIFSLIFILGLFTWNCSQQTEVSEPEYEFTEVAIPDIYKSDLKQYGEIEELEDFIYVIGKNGKEVKGKLRIVLPVDSKECQFISIELTKNILAETAITKDFFVQYVNNSRLKSTKDVADCFEKCDDRPHPGWCKFWCVVEILPL